MHHLNHYAGRRLKYSSPHYSQNPDYNIVINAASPTFIEPFLCMHIIHSFYEKPV